RRRRRRNADRSRSQFWRRLRGVRNDRGRGRGPHARGSALRGMDPGPIVGQRPRPCVRGDRFRPPGVNLSSPAPGVWRAGDALVNFYLVAEGCDLTLVDAGLPGHWDQLAPALATLGRSLSDVRAVLVTHAHPDHFGMAERIRQVADARVWV